MSWSYSGDPSVSDSDKVRFLIGDTLTGDQQLSNEEVASLLTDASDNVYVAAQNAVRALIARYARYPASKSVGDLSISYGELVRNYQMLLNQIRHLSGLANLVLWAGGISISDKDGNVEDLDLVKPAFRKGMHDHPGVSAGES